MYLNYINSKFYILQEIVYSIIIWNQEIDLIQYKTQLQSPFMMY